MFRVTARAAWCLFFCGGLLAASQPGVWLDVPFVKQEKNGCGAASIAMVMGYWHRLQGQAASDDAGQIQRALYSPGARGLYASEMEHYFQQHGFRVFAYRGEWNDLKEQLEKGRPLIVALNLRHGDLHYVVVTGLDWQRDLVLKNDPAERKLLPQKSSEFEKEWKAAGYWTLLAVPRAGE